MAEHGCVGILTTNGSPAMAPWGGREKVVGANPRSIAVPAGAHGFTVMVDLKIRPGKTAEFLAAIEENSRASLHDEPGCLRFDVHRSNDDPERFVLHEIYADEDAFYVAHRAAPHYERWLEAVEATVPEKSNAYFTPVR